MMEYSDQSLVVETLAGSHSAFEQLVKQYQYHVLRTISSLISDEHAAQDVAQETFLQAWCNLAKLKEKHKFAGWLTQMALNLSKRWLRNQRRSQGKTTSLEQVELDVVSQTPLQRYANQKLRQEIWEAIDELSRAQREVVILHYISGYSYKEIGDMLSISSSTVLGRLQKARTKLRKEFLDMVTKLQLEIDSTVHKFLQERAKQDGVSIEDLILRLIERYKMDMDKPEVAVRKIADAEDWGASSPDGRYLSSTHSRDLAVRDLTTGEQRNLDEGTWDRPGWYVDLSRWSPDGKYIAYGWCSYINPMELRVVGLDGSQPRVLYRNDDKEVEHIHLRGWSQDGKSLLVVLSKLDGSGDIALVSVADGSVRILKSLKGFLYWMDLSPDGRTVVYARPVEEHQEIRDIFLLTTDGSGEEVPLVEHPADDYGPVWMPDGKAIIFLSDRSGSYDAWLMPLADGKPRGEPQLVKRDTGRMQPMGFTREGSLYYGLYMNSTDIYVASIDSTTGELLEPPTKAIQRFEGFNKFPTWSPDGKSLAYMSLRPSPESSGRRAVLVLRSEETKEERELSTSVSLGRLQGRLRWSPDGRSILYGYRRTLQLVDVQTGDVTSIVQFDPADKIGISNFAWSPDGEAVYYICLDNTPGEDAPSKHLVMHNLATGEEKELDKCGDIVGWLGLAVSPDGRQLAFAFAFGSCSQGYYWGLKVMPAEGGEPHVLIRSQDPVRHYFAPEGGFAWTPDGRYVLFGRLFSPSGKGSGRHDELWRIPAEGGEAQKLLEMEELSSISVHPDGQRIAFTVDKSNMEVWAMENFLPSFTSSK